MYQTYAARPKAKKNDGPAVSPAQGPSLADLQRGAMPTQEQFGTPVNLSSAIQAKMESAFGADFSGIQLHESQTVAEAGADAVTMGRHIAFAPGKLSAPGGQELLGHELSHVVSQARGEVSGRGFLDNSALEARADQEGAMAAAGESVYAGPMTPLSASSTAAAAGPMQARKAKSKEKLTAPGFDRKKDLNSSGGTLDNPGFFLENIIGEKGERTRTTVNPYALAGMSSKFALNDEENAKIKNNSDPKKTLREKLMQVMEDRFNASVEQNSRDKSLVRCGVKDKDSVTPIRYTQPTDDEAGVTAESFGGEGEGKIKGHVFKPANNKNNGKHVILYSGSDGTNLEQMQGNIQKYLMEGYTVHSFDYGGFGESTTSDGKVSEQSIHNDAQRIYDHVLGGKDNDGAGNLLDRKANNVLLHGFSLGGSMASWVAGNAALKAAQNGNKDEDKLGGLVLESAIKNTTDAAASMMGPVIGTLGGAMGSLAAGSFDTEANLNELAGLDKEMPITFISGGSKKGDHLSDERTGLSKMAGKKFTNVQNQVLQEKDHMAPDKMSSVWQQIKGKIMRGGLMRN